MTATDLALHITQMLRAQKVVGKFVEFYGEGAASLPVPDRATIGNMAPEYGATMGFFPIDEESVNYLRATGRTDEQCAAFENYFRAQKMFGMPRKGEIDYSVDLELDLGRGAAERRRTETSAGPDQSCRSSAKLSARFLQQPVKDGGYGKENVDLREKHPVQLNGSAPHDGGHALDRYRRIRESSPAKSATNVEMVTNRPTPDPAKRLKPNRADPFQHGESNIGHGSVLIAAITSCTNTSNPSVMLAAGLLAKKAVERGLRSIPAVKTSLAPVRASLPIIWTKTGLQTYLDQLGFNLVGYGCTTCIGNSGPLHPKIEKAINEYDLVAASVLSGNRNFEARVHQNIKANFLMSPPLVVAFALAGRVDHRSVHANRSARTRTARKFFCAISGRRLSEIRDAMQSALTPEVFRKLYRDFAEQNPKWNEIPSSTGDIYQWDEKSDYIHEPPFFEDFSMEPGQIAEHRGRARAGDFRRLGYDRSHFTGGRDQSEFTRGAISDVTRNSAGGFQQLRQPPRQ